eukprot:c3615_g1_i1.p1 GENE.c3615_g1_i1~~c3615_g1_i1.p1  ORF type:complete len:686 (-),score=170.45 c3615_g1_i1:63-2120(-)
MWIGVLAATHSSLHQPHNDSFCDANVTEQLKGFDYFKLFLITSLACHTVCFFLLLVITHISLRGTILNNKPRRHLPTLLYIRFVVLLVEILLVIAGFHHIFFSNSLTCSGLPYALRVLMRFVVVTTLLSTSTFLISMCAVFDTTGGHGSGRFEEHLNWRRNVVQNDVENAVSNYDRLWYHRLRCLCICGSAHASAYEEVAQLFSNFFMNMDVVPSDGIAALILIRRLQLEQESEMVVSSLDDNRDVPLLQQRSRLFQTPGKINRVTLTERGQITANAVAMGSEDPSDRAILEDSIRFVRYAIASYGWMMFTMMNPATALCRLCRCCGAPNAVGDNCCRCNASAVREQTKFGNDVEIVYESFRNDFLVKPFLVAVDHNRKAVILSIRGTLSVSDCITDGLAQSFEVDIPLPPNQFNGNESSSPPAALKAYVHKGMWLSAKAMVDLIDANQSFKAAVEQYPEYRIIITGHSLGGGLSVLVSLLLRVKPLFARLRCFAFAPPPVVSVEAAVYCESFLLSIFGGKDLVPRMSVRSLTLLRNDMVTAVSRAKVSKTRILCSGGCCGLGATSTKTLLSDPEQVHPLHGPLSLKKLESFSKSERSLKGTENEEEEAAKRLVLAGKVLHVAKIHTSATRGCICPRKQRTYRATWAQRTDFQTIQVSPLMVTDHLPHNLEYQLNQAYSLLLQES